MARVTTRAPKYKLCEAKTVKMKTTVHVIKCTYKTHGT